jgi:Xaa-Pro aminopeptidase
MVVHLDIDPRTPQVELYRRHDLLQSRLETMDVDLVLVTTNPNLYYLTGSIQNGMVAVSKELSEPVYLVKRIFERGKWESALNDIRAAVPPSELINTLGIPGVKKLGLELDLVPHGWAERIRKGVGGEGVELVDVSYDLRELRSVKTYWEVQQIAQAGKQVDAAMERVKEVLTEGITELEVSIEAERTMRALGHEGFVRMHRFNSEMYYGGVLSGPSATVPSWHQAVMGGHGLSPALPHGASRRKIKKGEPVAVDLCGTYRGYIADETRIFVMGGLRRDLHVKQLGAQEILRTLEREVRPGMVCADAWKKALHIAQEFEVEDSFMGVDEHRLKFIGHGVGIELDELPILADRIRSTIPEDAVVALEPKLVFPEIGVLGEENTYHVTSGGLKRLTNAPSGLTQVG